MIGICSATARAVTHVAVLSDFQISDEWRDVDTERSKRVFSFRSRSAAGSRNTPPRMTGNRLK